MTYAYTYTQKLYGCKYELSLDSTTLTMIYFCLKPSPSTSIETDEILLEMSLRIGPIPLDCQKCHQGLPLCLKFEQLRLNGQNQKFDVKDPRLQIWSWWWQGRHLTTRSYTSAATTAYHFAGKEGYFISHKRNDQCRVTIPYSGHIVGIKKASLSLSA